MPPIDALALKTGLLDGGMPEPQATAIVNALADADIGQLATKADLEVLKGELKALNGKVNLVLAFNTPLLFAVLALLWRSFFAGAN